MQVKVPRVWIRRSLLVKDGFSCGGCRDIHTQRKGKQSISKLIFKQMNHCLKVASGRLRDSIKKGKKSEEE